MPDKFSPLYIALEEVQRLRAMLNDLPDPRTGHDWQPDYIRWWFKHLHKNSAGLLPPEPTA